MDIKAKEATHSDILFYVEANKETYTQRIFKKNKLIFLIIKLIIGVTYLWISFIFLFMLQRTSFSIIGIIIASVICYLAYRSIHKEEEHNKKM